MGGNCCLHGKPCIRELAVGHGLSLTSGWAERAVERGLGLAAVSSSFSAPSISLVLALPFERERREWTRRKVFRREYTKARTEEDGGGGSLGGGAALLAGEVGQLALLYISYALLHWLLLSRASSNLSVSIKFFDPLLLFWVEKNSTPNRSSPS